MPLPDLRALLAMPPEQLRALGTRLRAVGLDRPFLGKLARVGERLDDPLRAPLRVWHLRRSSGPAAAAARMLIFQDPVTSDEAAAVLGGPAGAWVEVGLLADRGVGLVGALHLSVGESVLLLGDTLGSDALAVMGVAGATTLELCRAAAPTGRVARILDLGAGAGMAAITLARHAERVTATDLNPRAEQLLVLNCRLNGIANVEARTGDLFAPVLGETFDLIVSQPPFVACPEGSAQEVFLHGGRRGDELTLRLLSEVTARLTPEGQAVVIADWPVIDGDDVLARVARAVGAGAEVLLLESPGKNVDEYAAFYTAAGHPGLGPEFAKALLAYREHLERVGVRSMALGFVIVRRAAAAGWSARVGIRHLTDAPVTGAAVARLFAAHRIALGPLPARLASRLRMAPGAIAREQVVVPGEPPHLVLSFPADRLVWPAVLEPRAARTIQRIHRAERVEDAGEVTAREEHVELSEARSYVAGIAADALRRGALEPG